MLLEYSFCFQAMPILHLFLWVMLIPQFFCTNTTCHPPDFPEAGRYEPKKAEYAVGDEIHYFCKGELPMFGENKTWLESKEVICHSNGKWSGRTPFCDKPAKLENPSKELESTVSDGYETTCIPTRNDTEELLRFTLDSAAVVYGARVCWSKGKKELKLTVHEFLDYTRQTKSWEDKCFLAILPDNNLKSKFVTIHLSSETARSISLCLVEVFTTGDDWCDHLPENSVPNSRLAVSRSRAVLHCYEGFREKDGVEVYATCENNTWSYLSLQCVEISCDTAVVNVSLSEGYWSSDSNTSEYSHGTNRTLRCKPGHHSEGHPLTVTCQDDGNWTRSSATCEKDTPQKDYKILAAVIGSVIALLIFIMLGVSIFCIRRGRFRRIFTTHKISNVSTIPSVAIGSITCLAEVEYSST